MPPGREESFREFLVQQGGQVDLAAVAFNLLIAAVFALLLGQLYIHYGRSPSDRRTFAAQFLLITMTTTIIIVVVKASLALSLGLVGALSIVRFRSAVREHEELAFLFLAIALGLCLGANQRRLAILAFGVIGIVLMLRGWLRPRVQHENLYLKVQAPGTDDDALLRITDILRDACTTVKLKRCETTDDVIETSFQVQFRDLDGLVKVQNELRTKMRPAVVSVIDGDGIL